jgi:hypothetical protein
MITEIMVIIAFRIAVIILKGLLSSTPLTLNHTKNPIAIAISTKYSIFLLAPSCVGCAGDSHQNQWSIIYCMVITS